MKYHFTRCTAAMPATRFESPAGAGLASLALAIGLSLAAVTAKAADPAAPKTAAADNAAGKPQWVIVEEDF